MSLTNQPASRKRTRPPEAPKVKPVLETEETKVGNRIITSYVGWANRRALVR